MAQYKQKTVATYQGSPFSLQNSSKNKTKPAAKNPKRQYSNGNNKPPKKALALTNGVVHKEVSNGVCDDEKNLLSKEAEIAKMNLKTLQKVDAGIGKILATVPHVVLYQYRGTENIWVCFVVVLLLLVFLLLFTVFARVYVNREVLSWFFLI